MFHVCTASGVCKFIKSDEIDVYQFENSSFLRVIFIEGTVLNHDSVQSGFEATFARAYINTTCKKCPQGTYKKESGHLQCVPCTSIANSYCPPGTATLGRNMGFALLHDADEVSKSQCVECKDGTYKNTTDAKDQCKPCDIGTYADTPASAVCKKCPANSSTVLSMASNASSDCICMPGFTVDGGGMDCMACEIGTYKVAHGNEPCSTCPSGTSSVSGSNELTQCTCLAEYEGSNSGE